MHAKQLFIKSHCDEMLSYTNDRDFLGNFKVFLNNRVLITSFSIYIPSIELSSMTFGFSHDSFCN